MEKRKQKLFHTNDFSLMMYYIKKKKKVSKDCYVSSIFEKYLCIDLNIYEAIENLLKWKKEFRFFFNEKKCVHTEQ